MRACTRRRFAAALATGPLATLWPRLTAAQGKPLRLLVGFPPGGALDVVARELAEALRPAGYNVVVDNRAGAGGRIAVEQLLQAPPDGATLVIMPLGIATIYPHVYATLRYDPLKDLAPLATVCSYAFALAVGPGTPARTLAEFIDWAKANPKLASYGTPGGGTAMHFMGTMLARAAGIELTHVPYRGGAAAVTDAIGGTVPALVTTLPAVLGPHKQGRLRILAYTAEQPLASLPGVPTFRAAGFPELVLRENFGVYAAARTPAAMQAELHQALSAAAAQPRVGAALGKLEFEPMATTQAQFAALLKADFERWAPVVKATGYRAED